MDIKIKEFSKHLKSDQMGTFMVLDVDDLYIDHTYQRPLTPSKVQQIAKDWAWGACGALSVALRASGKCFVYDGQNRYAAAVKRGIEQMPCMVFEFKNRQAEAAAFIAVNTNRKLPTSVEQFTARLMAKDPVALKIAGLCEQFDRAVLNTSSGRVLKAVGKVKQCIERDEGALERIWPLLNALSGDHPIQSHLIGGLWWLESNLPQGVSLVQVKWRKKVLKTGADELIQAGNYYASAVGQRGDRVLATGMMHRLNKHVPAYNRLTLPD